MSIEFLDHTSDIGVRVSSSSLENAFKESAVALLQLIFSKDNFVSDGKHNVAAEIEISGIDSPSLLVNFLNEILYLVDSENVYPTDINVELLGPKHLILKFNEKCFDLENHPINLYVKAVTFHQLKIFHDEDNIIIEKFLM